MTARLDPEEFFASLGEAFGESVFLGLSASRHVAARQAILQAWSEVQPSRQLTTSALQLAQAVAAHETSYGNGWGSTCGGAGVGSHNWGAVQKSKPPCPSDSFLCQDSYPTSSGSVTYAVCFKSYPDDVSGAADVIRNLTAPRRPQTDAALDSGSAQAMAEAMYDEHYYQGFGPDRATRVGHYADALFAMAQEIATANGEPLAVARTGGIAPTLLGGSVLSSTTGKIALAGVALAIGIGVAAASVRRLPMAPFIKGDLVTLVYADGEEIAMPRFFVMVHDQTGGVLPPCDVFLVPRDASKNPSRSHPASIDEPTEKAVEAYYGRRVTWPLRGFDLPSGPWNLRARVREIRYRRRMPDGKLEGFYHPYSYLVDFSEGRRGYRIRLGDGCFYNHRGYVRP